MANSPGSSRRGWKSSSGGVEGRRQRALGVHLADQHPLARAGRQLGQGRGDRRLADAALPRHEQQLVVEQVLRRRHGRRSASEADAAVAVVRAHLDVGELGRRHPDLAPRLSFSHSTSTSPASAASTLDRLVPLVVGHLDHQLARRLGDADPNVHGAHGNGRPVRSRTASARLMAEIVGYVSLTPRRRVATMDAVDVARTPLAS